MVMADGDAAMVAAMTGLAIAEATMLLDAAGDPDAAVSLHFDGAPVDETTNSPIRKQRPKGGRRRRGSPLELPLSSDGGGDEIDHLALTADADAALIDDEAPLELVPRRRRGSAGPSSSSPPTPTPPYSEASSDSAPGRAGERRRARRAEERQEQAEERHAQAQTQARAQALAREQARTPCVFFGRGYCRYGKRCRFSHDEALCSTAASASAPAGAPPASPTSPTAPAAADQAAAPPAAQLSAPADSCFPELSTDLWGLILESVLGARELCRLGRVSRVLRRLSLSPALWEAAHARVFGERGAPALASAAPGVAPPCALVSRRLCRSEARMEPWRRPPSEHASASTGWSFVGSGAAGAEEWRRGGRGGRGGGRGEDCPAAVRAIFYDGEGLLASADGGCVRLWSMARRERICSLKSSQGRDSVHAGGVSCLSIDEGTLLSGGGDGSLHLFDLGEQSAHSNRTTLRGHGSPIYDCRLVDGHGPVRARAISSSTDGAVKIWSAAGGWLGDLLPPLAHGGPTPLPLCFAAGGGGGGGGGGGWEGGAAALYCARDACLLGLDLATEAAVARVPLPEGFAVSLASDHPGEHRRESLALAEAGLGGGLGSAGPGSGQLLASSALDGELHLWDLRLMPAPQTAAEAEADPLLDAAATAARRARVASIALPDGAQCARHLHLDGARLLASLDYEGEDNLFARSARSVALFDVRGAAAGGQGRLLWEQAVPGEISCLQCRNDVVLLGTATGAVRLWQFAARGAAAAGGGSEGGGGLGDEDNALCLAERRRERPQERRAKEAPRARAKGRRFPKTQGFGGNHAPRYG